MIDEQANTWHPLPRYGLAALIESHRSLSRPLDIGDDETLLKAATTAVEQSLSTFLLKPHPNQENQTVRYTYVNPGSAVLEYGNKVNRASKDGYYVAPHILVSSNANKALTPIYGLIEHLNSKKSKASWELKQAFAPTANKANRGKASQTYPKVDLLEAILTVFGTLCSSKAAAYDKTLGQYGSNVGLIPDLPLSYLIEYIAVVRKLVNNAGEASVTGRIIDGDFKRPGMFRGNYAEAPTGVGLGAVGLLAAIGQYAKRGEELDPDAARHVLEAMADRPIYLIATGGSSQQTYSHHVVGLALSGALLAAAESLWRVHLLSIAYKDTPEFKQKNPKWKRRDDPAWKRFKITAENWMRLFSAPYFLDFLAHRAAYPNEFYPLFKAYFMEQQQIDRDVVESAEAFGKRINLAAYIGAQDEVKDDIRRKRGGMTDQDRNNKSKRYRQAVQNYKNRIITQFESTIGSAKEGAELIARISTIVGRSSGLDFKDEARLFMLQTASGELPVETSKQLATAFMRLRSPQEPSEEPGEASADAETSADAEHPAGAGTHPQAGSAADRMANMELD